MNNYRHCKYKNVNIYLILKTAWSVEILEMKEAVSEKKLGYTTHPKNRC